MDKVYCVIEIENLSDRRIGFSGPSTDSMDSDPIHIHIRACIVNVDQPSIKSSVHQHLNCINCVY